MKLSGKFMSYHEKDDLKILLVLVLFFHKLFVRNSSASGDVGDRIIVVTMFTLFW